MLFCNFDRYKSAILVKTLVCTVRVCEDIPMWISLYAVTRHLLTRRNFLFLNSLKDFWRSLDLLQRSHFIDFLHFFDTLINDLSFLSNSNQNPLYPSRCSSLRSSASDSHSHRGQINLTGSPVFSNVVELILHQNFSLCYEK